MANQEPDWPTCDHDDCIGSQVANTAWCLAHVDEPTLDAELDRIRAEGSVDARGVTISAELLARLLDAATPRRTRRPTFTTARFDQATFQDRAAFDWAIFQDRAGFDWATFMDLAKFDRATFEGGAAFDRATFKAEAWFRGATFQREAGFGEASFQSTAGFGEASFQGWTRFGGASFRYAAYFVRANWQGATHFTGASFQAWARFDLASFEGEVGFGRASFQGRAMFHRATFKDRVEFYRATFQGEARFDGASFQDAAGFDEASFERATQIGPLLARQLVLDGAVFNERVQLDVTAAAMCVRRTQFPAGVLLRLRYASVFLDDANLAAPAILAAVSSPFPELAEQERQVERCWQRLPPGPRQQRWRPRVLSLRRADVAGLRLANVDLRACRFAAAHNLDRLRIEGAPLFARTSGWWRARRKTLAEEHHWRVNRPGRWRPPGWYPLACQPPASAQADTPRELEPARLAAVYRDLRKGREDAKDEPGAADFYYGECEMRRHDPGTPGAERLVLWLYWLLSGYGLRAWRALTALAVVVVLAGIVLAFWGFPSGAPGFRPITVNRGGALVYEQQAAEPPPGLRRLPDAIRFSARSATVLLRGPDRALTPLGEWLEIGLRFIGPVLLGLAVLSVRGRVRR
jgi:uncharacterized protein YjbI with pentapeptide repeats